jgi:hypothetical protein
MRHAADTVEAVGSGIALVGIPAVTWLGFVEAVQTATAFLDLL